MALGIIPMKFSMPIRVLQRMNPNDFGNPLTCLDTSNISQHLCEGLEQHFAQIFMVPRG